jgi:hypothetical protein
MRVTESNLWGPAKREAILLEISRLGSRGVVTHFEMKLLTRALTSQGDTTVGEQLWLLRATAKGFQ